METATKQKDTVFSFDVLEELVDQYLEESEEEGNAAVRFSEDGHLTLTVLKFEDCEVKVYHVKESEEIYAAMEASYIELLEEGSSGSDFWDMWNSVIGVFTDYCIVEEVFNP